MASIPLFCHAAKSRRHAEEGHGHKRVTFTSKAIAFALFETVERDSTAAAETKDHPEPEWKVCVTTP